MARNIEIKARVADPGAIERRLARLHVRDRRNIEQHDTFFHVGDGRLKLRRFGDGTAELIFYRRPDRPGPGLSVYHRAPCADPPVMGQLLSAAFGVRGEVRKHRTVVLVGQTRVHLDRVEGLGEFLELEVVLSDDQTEAEGRAMADELMTALGISADDLIDGAYIDLQEAKQAD